MEEIGRGEDGEHGVNGRRDGKLEGGIRSGDGVREARKRENGCVRVAS